MKEELLDFIAWVEQESGEDAFYIFDHPDEAVARYIDTL